MRKSTLKPVLIGVRFIDPYEKYIIFSSGRDGQEFDDLYCSFKNENGTWSDPVKFDYPANSEFNDRFPRVSPDGRYLFFARPQINWKRYFKEPQSLKQLLDRYAKSNDDIYWVDAKVIEELSPKNLK